MRMNVVKCGVALCFLIAAMTVDAQQAAPTAPVLTPAQTTQPAQPQSAPPISLNVPNSFSVRLEGLPAPSAAPGWFGSLFLAAIVTGIASLIGIVVSADKRRKLEVELETTKQQFAQTEKQMTRMHEQQLQELADRSREALAEKDRKFQAAMKADERQHQSASQLSTLGREDHRIEIERDRLRLTTDASALEIEVSATRLAREQGVQLANLINTFFDQLSSNNAAHRELALLAMSGFVDVDEFRQFLAERFDPCEPPPRDENDDSDSPVEVAVSDKDRPSRAKPVPPSPLHAGRFKDR